MLRSATVALAERSIAVTSVAHTEKSLSALGAILRTLPCTHHMLRLDWSLPDQFIGSVIRHLEVVGPPDLVIGWFHDDQLGVRLASLLGSRGFPLRFVQILGSSAADPSLGASSLLKEFHLPHAVSYHQVVLGFVISGRRSRWLTDEEISNGVLRAIAQAAPQHVVGTICPWSARP